MSNTNSPLQYALTSNAFPPIPLQKNTLYTIGRDQGNTIVLIDDLVSRFHASILVDLEGKVFVEDRNSRNGILLNGNKVRQRTLLQVDDKITVGTYQIFFKNLTTAPKSSNLDEISSTTMALNDLGSPDGMVGTLQLMSVTELFTTLEYNEKTGLLLIFNGVNEASLYFRKGNIIRAEFKNLRNLDAVFSILSFLEGTFEFKSQEFEGMPNEIPLTTQQIFIEYARSLNS
ncbi:MAG: FHA domain-containing protein [Planctomycetota bacterium]